MDNSTDPSDLKANNQIEATIVTSDCTGGIPNHLASFKHRKAAARASPTNRIEIKVLYLFAALIRMRTIAELLTHLAAAVWVKHREIGKPSEEIRNWKPHSDDQAYQFVLSQLPAIATMIGTTMEGSRKHYWIPITTVVTLPDPEARGGDPDGGPIEEVNEGKLTFPLTEFDLLLGLSREKLGMNSPGCQLNPCDQRIALRTQVELFESFQRCSPVCGSKSSVPSNSSLRPVCTCGSLYLPSLELHPEEHFCQEAEKEAQFIATDKSGNNTYVVSFAGMGRALDSLINLPKRCTLSGSLVNPFLAKSRHFALPSNSGQMTAKLRNSALCPQ